MGKTRALLVSFNKELTEQNKDLQLEMKYRLEEFDTRMVALENRLDDIAKSIEIRHADMWKLVTEINASLPMTVAMSIGEVMSKLTESIKADIADTRVEISGLLLSEKLNDD